MFFNIINLFYLINLILFLIFETDPLQTKITYSIYPLGAILAQFILEFYKLFYKYSFYQKSIKKKYWVLNQNKDQEGNVFEYLKAQDLKMGDIIVLS